MNTCRGQWIAFHKVDWANVDILDASGLGNSTLLDTKMLPDIKFIGDECAVFIGTTPRRNDPLYKPN